jgi:membrane-bound inhibitor of C-type lysozyme
MNIYMKFSNKQSGLASVVIILAVVALIVAGIAAYLFFKPKAEVATPATPPPPPVVADTLISTVAYTCADTRNLTAAYYDSAKTSIVAAGEKPAPTGSVEVTANDGSKIKLPQTISASGVRYADATEKTVFWNKGHTAMISVDAGSTTVSCIEVAKDSGGLPQSYASSTLGFSIRFPLGYSATTTYAYTDLGPGKTIRGVKFTIPASVATGTNLSSDSYVSVEHISGKTECSADMFLRDGATGTEDINGMTYSIATSTGAAAGNRYEESVFALPGTNPCIAVRYFIHYGVFENYPAGTVTEFDKAALMADFKLIRNSLVI